MKALTICQPYAHLIAIGDKHVENRTWPTRYRGPLLIHAGKSRAWLDGDTDADLIAEFGELPAFGAVVATATLADCVRVEQILAGQLDASYPFLADRAHCGGPYCFVLTDVQRVDPFPCAGRQGLFGMHWPPVREDSQ